MKSIGRFNIESFVWKTEACKIGSEGCPLESIITLQKRRDAG